MDNLEHKVKEVMSIALEIPLDAIDEKTSNDSIENWDSLKHMNLIIALEEEFKIALDIDRIVEMNSFLIICKEIEGLVNGNV